MYVDLVKVVPSNLSKALQALSNINKAELADELYKLLL
jgi:hypothetical protein